METTDHTNGKYRNAVLTYQDTQTGTNIGDYIQSLAASQYFPHIDYLINREELDEFSGENCKLIMNGWFTHHPEHWIPSKVIKPLFVAFHINASSKDRMLTPAGVEYLKGHEPIGCRDTYTVEILKGKGIDAYFSGCLTLTLDNKYRIPDSQRTNDIYIVDPLFNINDFSDHFKSPRSFLRAIKHNLFLKSFQKKRFLRKIIDKKVRKNAIYTFHTLKPNNIPDDQRFAMAEDLLHKYAKARLVITSRIHCALPCLALGTPVIFINSFEDKSNQSRIKGLMNLFNRIDLNTKSWEFKSNFDLVKDSIDENICISNPTTYQKYASDLKRKCEHFVNATK